MKTFMNITGVVLLLSAIVLFFVGCSSLQTPPRPATPVPALRIQTDQVMAIGQSNVLSLSNGFTGTVDLRWQWPTNCNTAAFGSAYAIIQVATNIGPGLSLSNGWQSLATIPYTAAPEYSFNVTNSVQQYFRWRITVPGLY